MTESGGQSVYQGYTRVMTSHVISSEMPEETVVLLGKINTCLVLNKYLPEE